MTASLPTDTLFSQQWYLYNTIAGQYDINVAGAWEDYTGKGVKVMVIDDGFDYTHPDIAPNYDTTSDYDFSVNDGDPSPTSHPNYDMHGTPVMGLIGAARDGSGIVGVAYGATLVGARVGYGIEEAVFVNLLADYLDASRADGTDVVNMSFNGDGASVNLQGSVAVLDAAIQRSVDDGRDGLGTILVRSAGNSDGWFGFNGDGFNANSLQVTVGALDEDGFVTSYSSEGAHLLVSAFGSEPSNIITTDRLGTAGYSADDYTSFDGTSAATPMVSGVVALMLEANSGLGWRDVHNILAYSARHVGSAIDGVTTSSTEAEPWLWNSANNWNGGGLHFNQAYGYGLVDAHAAVRLAESWDQVSTSNNERHLSLDVLDDTMRLADPTGERLFSAELKQSVSIERVVVTFDAIAFGDTKVDLALISPDGQEISLSHLPKGRLYYGPVSYHSEALRGQTSAGEWQVRIDADLDHDAARLRDIKIDIYGAKASSNDRYFYTDEFADWIGNDHVANLKDNNGGTDLLNAAAVTTDMTVNLTAGTGRIDGVDMVIKGIEHVFGGDGDDTLRGSSTANDLAGGRGEDTLAGGKGDDSFIFRVLRDSVAGAYDVIKDFGRGADLIDLSDIDTMAKPGDQGFRYIGSDKSFNGRAAELHFLLIDKAGTQNDHTMIEADLDGDKNADFQIDLSGLHNLEKADFVL